MTISSGTQQARDTTTGILFGLVQGPTKDSMSLLFEHRVVQILIWKTGFAEVRLGIYLLGRRKEGPETFVEDHCPFSSRIPILKQCFIPLGQLVGFERERWVKRMKTESQALESKAGLVKFGLPAGVELRLGPFRSLGCF